MQQINTITQKSAVSKEEWLRILTKGMVTIPKPWRQAFNLQEGSRVLARNIGNQIILEPLNQRVPYRIYTQEELAQFLKDDALSPQLKQKLNKKLQTK